MENTHRIFIVILYILSSECEVVRTVSFNCTFDDGFCNWTTVRSVKFNIEWSRQETATSNTGPDSDHTSGVGSFIYINTSQELVEHRARLTSQWQSRGKYCLSFWYYMYGRYTDIIWIAWQDENANEKTLFHLTKNQRNAWRFKDRTIEIEKQFKIIIQGTIIDESHKLGYIAVDDVKIFPGKCPKRCSDRPTPEFSKTVVGDIWKGSVVNISCREGYEIKGNSSIMCQDDGKWSDTPSCQPVDCGNLTLGNGLLEVTSENTTFNTIMSLSCSRGFTMVENSSITCMANGNWYILPRCVINNCSDPTPSSGYVGSRNFSVGSSVQISCDTSYKLVGDSQVHCQINSTWSDIPVCERIECTKPTLNGLLEPNGTTWYTKEFIVLSCADNHILKGNATITCQDNGNWTKLPTCDYNEESDYSALIAVAVSVPLLAIGILCITIFVVCRNRKLPKSLKGDTTPEQDMKAQAEYLNKRDGDHDKGTKKSAADTSLVPDNIYAVVVKKKSPETANVVCSNTVKHEDHLGNNDYDHMESIFAPSLDNTYSYIESKGNDSKKKQIKTSTDPLSNTNAAFLESDDDECNHINLRRPKVSLDKKHAEQFDEDQESEYENAKADGCNPLKLDMDTYSNLSTADRGHGNYGISKRKIDVSCVPVEPEELLNAEENDYYNFSNNE